MTLSRKLIVTQFVIQAALFAGTFGDLLAADGVQYPLSIAVSGSTIMLADRNLPGIWKLEGGIPSAYFTGSKKF